MALVIADRVQETTTTTGTGQLSLGGAVTGFRTFATIGVGNTTYYCITDGTNWEVGIGIYQSVGNILQRFTILASSNSNAVVNFPAGPKTVFGTYPAGRSVALATNGAFRFPEWTTANRPASPQLGDIGFNTTLSYPEWYDGAIWFPLSDQPTYTVDYLVVGGGGGGGVQGGGGGAGGFLAATGYSFTRGVGYGVAVGASGAVNTNGGTSTFATINALGGGRGGWAAGTVAGGTGGSGGGSAVVAAASTAGGSGTVGQGNNGGANAGNVGAYGGGGGGGAGAVGAAGTGTAGGAGGAGASSSITGTATLYARGGGGGLFTGTTGGGAAGTGGAGTGGAGSVNAGSGASNTGDGGGGSGTTTGAAGTGGSGVVILKYNVALTLSIGVGLVSNTVTSGSFKITTFTSGSGTVTWS